MKHLNKELVVCKNVIKNPKMMTTVMRQFNFDEIQLYKNRSTSDEHHKELNQYHSVNLKEIEDNKNNGDNTKTREAIGVKLISNESYAKCSPRRPVTTLNNTLRMKATHFRRPRIVTKENYKQSSMGSLFSKRSWSVLMNSILISSSLLHRFPPSYCYYILLKFRQLDDQLPKFLWNIQKKLKDWVIQIKGKPLSTTLRSQTTSCLTQVH